MKHITVLIVSLVMMLIVGLSTTAQAEPDLVRENLYAKVTLVVEVDYETDEVTTEDMNGNLWSFYGTEDWMVGDICSLVMDTNGTDIIYDDSIVDARYDGYIK